MDQDDLPRNAMTVGEAIGVICLLAFGFLATVLAVGFTIGWIAGRL